MPVLRKDSMEWHKYCKEITILLRLWAEDRLGGGQIRNIRR